MMSLSTVWLWLAMLQRELLLFAATCLAVGACQERRLDGLWAWLRITGRACTLHLASGFAATPDWPARVDRGAGGQPGAAAVLVPVWSEAPGVAAVIEHCLAAWPNADLRLYVGCHRNDPATLAASRIVTATRSDPAYVAFGMLRTRIFQEMHRNGWTSLAVTSPTAGCGKTLVSLNLAFSFAHQKDCRTLLLDMDLSRSRMNELLGLKTSTSVDQLLQGLTGPENVFVRYGDNLALATSARPMRFSAELLQNARTGEILTDVRHKLRPNVIIYDMPPMLSNDDLMAFLPTVDCAILVTAAETTKFAEADRCERELAERTNLLGVVLNKCRYTQEEYGY